MELTRKVNRRMDGGHDIIQPVFDGHIKIKGNNINIVIKTMIFPLIGKTRESVELMDAP